VWFEQVVFFLAAIGALGGAVGVVVLRNPFFSVLSLVAHLISLAVLFLLLRAEFLAAAQVVVYAGAVMVLYVFVVAYIGGVDEPLGAERTSIARLGPLFAAALVVEIAIAVIGSGLSALDSQGPDVPASFGTPAEIGRLLLERYLIAFEAASMLLLVAAVGAVVLARRRRGLEDFDAYDLPERSGNAPIGGQGGPSVPGEDKPTSVPAGTAEGAGDPTVTRSPDHETQENPKHDPQPVEPVSDAEPVGGGTPA
jgi:NADH:ubiquinone oxidoreductase subunit 6 (subunit J)